MLGNQFYYHLTYGVVYMVPLLIGMWYCVFRGVDHLRAYSLTGIAMVIALLAWLIRDGVMKNQSELAHYAQVTTARMTHIMWLTNLAPEIQEAILFLPRVESGPDTVKEIEVRGIARVMDWGVQGSMGLSQSGVTGQKHDPIKIT
jgi:hypothetical protein